ncbi:DUF3106 domain-containing protein [Chromobacterium sphagni]|uniref:DUF3106 domain-containing protein n=1 Tax=Chromobacterium sphagni TaxID=1903179 RepID=A0A1S1WYW3_9NEIS|nr:DUF3106 domain-containing protein [Chromobacterium sphagni]OHX12462.1 hypothetical protein BI347_02320 [Chromobacterium sphagni]OHX21454.1 hypothetical protein BI344_02685 [Chromobacterium sphagni]
MNKARRLACALLSLSSLLVPQSSHASPPADPLWDQLNSEQQQVLSPLAAEWNRYAPDKKRNLLAIVPRFIGLPPQQQQRVRQKLKTWSELSQPQRDQIRANWKKLQQLPPEQRELVMRRLRERSAIPEASQTK